MSNYHRCEALNSVVPLKDDEEYCVYVPGTAVNQSPRATLPPTTELNVITATGAVRIKRKVRNELPLM